VSESQRAPAPDALTLLAEGDVELQGRMPWSSNATFLVTVTLGAVSTPAIYKPGRGERPLWDFPDGLYRREAAAYELSRSLGWGLVPETLVRDDGPLGPGSLQRFVPADFSEHYFTLLEDPTHHEALLAIATFDLVANNADRKSGHCLLGDNGRVWAIDHGLCFHPDPKLRTVIWDFGGRPVPAQLLPDLQRLAKDLPEPLATLLHEDEREALRRRAAAIVDRPCFPNPSEHGRAYPWPLV